MTLSAGTTLGPYQIETLLGAGGTGEVYRARDTRLNRTVAIKTLPPSWADDPAMRTRFEHEAQTIAKLSHPHICTLHDIGEASDPRSATAGPLRFLVMEYLEGQTLAQRLQLGPLPLDQGLNAAIAIADAMDKAHREGITHRDLKPSNVMLTPDGVKLLDFGVAATRHGAGDSSPPAVTGAPAMNASAGAARLISGTLEYMAPEQLEGAAADARTDIFAFGALLFEMLTGKKAFDGKTRPVLIAAIMSADPDPLSSLQPAVPPALDRLVKRCLAKSPDDRWQTAHDLMVQLRWIVGHSGVVPGATAPARGKRDRLMLGVLAATALLVGVLATPALLYFRGPSPAEAFQFRIPVFGLSPADIGISPDGESIAFVARPNTADGASLFVRPTGDVNSRRLAGTDDSAQPFWSPDSRSIAFVAGGRLKKVDASGGAPKDLAEAPDFRGGAWNGDGTMLFGSAKGLFRVSAEGGKPELITAVGKKESGHFWPSFLTDGRHYLYLAWSGEAADRAVFLGTLDAKEQTRLMTADSNVTYAAPGYLVFHRDATLFGQPFDAKSLATTGEPFHVADGVSFNSANGRGSFDVSQNGVLLYHQGQGGQVSRARIPNFPAPTTVWGWRDRTGKQPGVVHEPGPYGDMDASPDGKRMAVTRQEVGATTADIWVIDLERAGVPTRLTLDPADDINPVWSPDGARIAFTTFRKGNADVYVKNANGVGADTPLLESSSDESIEDWSKDGRYIAYKFGQDAFEDIWVLPTFGDKKPFAFVQGRFRKDEPQFSYDGKWLAYTSDESGQFQVYVISFPSGDQKIQVSKDGGGQPRWRRDGKELFYKDLADQALAVDLKPGTLIESGVPHVLFVSPSQSESRNPVRHTWSAAPDGQRFLIRYPTGTTPAGARGGTGAIPAVPNSYTPSAQPGSAAPAAAPSAPTAGLTVVRQWTSAGKK